MLRFALLAVLLLGLVAPAAADYPERALTIVVAYPAGGMVDIVARPMADSMKKTFTKGVAVLNRPGGGGSVGMAEVAQAKPDGYTVVLAPNSTLVIHPQLNELPYKTPDDYEPILNTITFYTLLTVKADAPWKTCRGSSPRPRRIPESSASAHPARGRSAT
jgi:tripartite-type tricarboxylate transporter receptor subunit TctC